MTKQFVKPAPFNKPETADEWKAMFLWAIDALLCMEVRAEDAERLNEQPAISKADTIRGSIPARNKPPLR